MSQPVRVRIAPSPSGHLHVGTARMAVSNWLFARHHGGTFILRIEDTDASRSYPEMVTSIQESLKWLGLDWDEGPHFQSQRGEIYERWVTRMRESGAGYLCYCTPEELAAKRELAQKEKRSLRYDGHCRDLSDQQRREYEAQGRSGALRLRIPQGETTYHDLVYKDMTRSNEDLDDFVCVRADGRPTYNFACVIDDHDMGITHVIRGNDHQTNTFKQILIYRALGLEPPAFAHLPLNLGKDRKKISKREGATSIIEYQKMGYLADALVNFLALLGWSPGDDREIMSRDELIEAYSLDRVSPSNPIFDPDKLKWMNGEYIRRMNTNDLITALMPFVMDAGLATRLEIETRWQWMLNVVGTLKERMHLLSDIAEQGAFYFTDEFEYDPKGVRKQFTRPGVDADMMMLASKFEEIPVGDFTKERAEEELRALAELLARKPAELIHPLRLALTGMTKGPGVFDIVALIGRDECTKRLRRAATYARTVPLE